MKQGEKKGVKGEEGKEEDEDEEEDESKTEPDRLLVYQQILEILRPGETVLKVIDHIYMHVHVYVHVHLAIVFTRYLTLLIYCQHMLFISGAD